MNRQEIKEWIKSAKYINTTESNYDGCGNHDNTRIYEKDGQLYELDFLDNEPNPKWGDKGWESERDAEGKRIKDARGQHIYIYEIRPVIAVPKITINKELVYVSSKDTIRPPKRVEIIDYYSKLTPEDIILVNSELNKYVERESCEQKI